MNRKTLDAHDFVYPVLATVPRTSAPDDDASFNAKTLCGTAFAIAPGLFATAAHVLFSATESSVPALGYRHSARQMRCATIGKYHVWKGCDVAIFEADFDSPKILPWLKRTAPNLTECATVGFPYGFDVERAAVVVRSFQGYTVSAVPWYRLDAHPTVYELPFPCPRGISGAPLCIPTEDGRFGAVIGIIIGNASTEMEVSSERETTSDGKTTTIYQKIEVLNLGIAISTDWFLAKNADWDGKDLHSLLKVVG